ncbi:MAG TPA: hypothetical protein VJV79_12550 [Polyangiaceae bacterium]|nr:hypothetical protein [Polyangiaceae bacterium]
MTFWADISITGYTDASIRYHFPGPGAQLRIDARDANVLDVIRGLRRIDSE